MSSPGAWIRLNRFIGDIAEAYVDLGQTTRYVVRRKELADSDGDLFFYRNPDGRWIRYDFSPWEDGEGSEEWIASFDFVDPREVVYQLSGVIHSPEGFPPELREYSEFADPGIYSAWLSDSPRSSVTAIRPVWDALRRTLTFQGRVVRTYGRNAPRQFDLLDRLEEAEWPESPRSLCLDRKWAQKTVSNTVNDFNKELPKGSPLKLLCRGIRVTWVREKSGRA